MKFNLNQENINYVKILYKDANDFSRCIKASIKSTTEYDIYACIKREEWEKIPSPQPVTLGFACENGLYKGESTLKYTRYEEPFLYICIKTPEEVEYQQNREYFRVNLVRDVVISYRNEDEVFRIQTKSHDISANGISVKLDEKQVFPDEVLIDISFETRNIRTKAKFVRIDSDEDFVKASFNFEELPENDLDFISRICIKKQIEDKRSSLE